MAARNHINPNQLAMFMSGEDLMKYVTESFDRRTFGGERESMDEMWDRKLDESKERTGHGANVYQSLASGWKEGEEPVPIIHEVRKGVPMRYLRDGHHRAASAADLQKRRGQEIYFPVEHLDWGKV